MTGPLSHVDDLADEAAALTRALMSMSDDVVFLLKLQMHASALEIECVADEVLVQASITGERGLITLAENLRAEAEALRGAAS